MMRNSTKNMQARLVVAAMLLAVASHAQEPEPQPGAGACGTSVSVEGTVNDILEAGSRVFAVTSNSGDHPRGGGLYISCNGGDTWFRHPELDPGGGAIASDPVDPNTIYVSVGGGFVYVSRDAGETWNSRRPVEIGKIGMSALTALAGGRLVAGTETGEILWSIDYGLNWTSRSLPIPNSPIRKILVDPDNINRVLVTIGDEGIFHSLDRGESFEHSLVAGVSMPVAYWDIADLAFEPSNRSQVYAAGPVGLSQSVDGGYTFSGIPGADNIVDISFGRRDTNMMFVVSEYSGVLRSSDGGQSFALLAPDLPGATDWFKSAQQLDGGRLLVGTAAYGIFKSDDDGETWQGAGTPPPTPPTQTRPPEVTANLYVTIKNPDGNKTLEAGTDARLRIEVRNNGPEPSTETFAHFIWSLPGTGDTRSAAFTLSGNKGSCAVTSIRDAGCMIGALGVGESAQIEFRGSTSTGHIGTHTMTVHASNAQNAAAVVGESVATKKTILCIGDCGGKSSGGGGAADLLLFAALLVFTPRFRAP